MVFIVLRRVEKDMGDNIVNVKFSTESIPTVRIDFDIDTSKTLFFCLFSISLQSILFYSHSELKFRFYEKFYTITQNIGSVLDKIENRRKTSIFDEKFHLNFSLSNSKMKKKILKRDILGKIFRGNKI